MISYVSRPGMGLQLCRNASAVNEDGTKLMELADVVVGKPIHTMAKFSKFDTYNGTKFSKSEEVKQFEAYGAGHLLTFEPYLACVVGACSVPKKRKTASKRKMQLNTAIGQDLCSSQINVYKTIHNGKRQGSGTQLVPIGKGGNTVEIGMCVVELEFDYFLSSRKIKAEYLVQHLLPVFMPYGVSVIQVSVFPCCEFLRFRALLLNSYSPCGWAVFYAISRGYCTLGLDPSFIPAIAMASSSTSSIQRTSFKYDVFLSFRGEDTRTNFVDHLYQALKLENIETYKDDENLERGKKISDELIQAIEDSRFHVIVFSKNYASSSWCLDELVKIIECQETPTAHIVFPIFYDVEPTQVRKQSGEFGKAFSKHENDEDAVKWRKALVEATSYSGKDLTIDKYEVEFIKKVVMEISLKLPCIDADKNLIGMGARINGILSSLNAFPDEFCMIGIMGMGGIGKTTLARAFEGKSFVANVREVSKPDFSRLKKLQQQVLRDVSNDQGITINNVFDGKNMMKKKMPGRKVLVVLDDVDHIDQLKALAGEPNWFKPGRYEELTKKVVRYAAGLPLTITVLGSSLCETNEHVWIDTLKKLKKIPLDETLKKLELSYMGLDAECKQIFLDVACILKGWSKDEVIRVLESRGFHAIHGLNVLEKKSLVTTRDGCLDMHDRIEEMGRYIVRSLHPDDPNKHSRLWITEEIKDILANNQDTEATCLKLFTSSKINQEAVMKGLEKMEKLKLLFVYISNIFGYWKLDESRMELLQEGGERKVFGKLRFLDLRCSKLKSFDLGLAPNLETLDLERCNDLVELEIRCECPQLKSLNLSSSKLRSLNLCLTPNIETLNLQYSKGLVKLDMPREFPQLKFLRLNCPNLRHFNLGPTPNVEALKLKERDYWAQLDMFLKCPQLESLELWIMLRTLDLGPTPNLNTLKLDLCYRLVNLRMHDECCKLKSLCLPCPSLKTFDLGPTRNFKALTLAGNDDLVEQFIPVRCPQLEYLKLIKSELRTFELTLNLKTLILKDCDLVELHIPDGDVKLESLAIERCSKLKTLDLRRTPNLESICLEECSSLVKLCIPNGGVKMLINLKGHLSTKLVDIHRLHLDGSLPKFEFECSYTEDLRSSIGNIEKLISEGFFCACTDLGSFFGRISGLQHLTKLTLEGNITELPKDLDCLQSLEELTLESTKIKHLPDSICMLKHLKSLKLYRCKLLEKLPEDLNPLECLETLELNRCTALRDIPNNICRMKSLRDLSLYGCNRIEELPEELGRLECLVSLDIRDTCINNLPRSILLLKKQHDLASDLEKFAGWLCIVDYEQSAFGRSYSRFRVLYQHGYLDQDQEMDESVLKSTDPDHQSEDLLKTLRSYSRTISEVEELADDRNNVLEDLTVQRFADQDPSFTPSMASSSTSSIHKTSFKYDVFLSFRGEDTRTNFIDHLYDALKRQGIDTYKDDKNLEKGKKISKELIQAIEGSRFHVIVFSKNYASSSWCLDELVKIMECQKRLTEHTVYPIFYDVEPTHVRKQSGEFGKAFAKHENDEAAKKWKEALIEATSLSGRELRTTADGHEVDFIKLVVTDISLKLPVVSADENLVGMRTRVNVVLSSINAIPDEFCMIGIWGMGGGGKTTLARAVFDQICNEFEGSSFVENVRESSTNPLLGLKSLQQQVLRDVFKKQDIFVNGVLEGKKEMKKKMHGIKALVVLDDVDHIHQLKALAGDRTWFKKGSVIIITTRDEQVLRSHDVEPIQVNLLSNEEALSLFCMNAFGTEIPVQGYEELSREVVSYAAGLPLTITVLGSHLRGRSTCGWEGVLKSLKRMPKKEVVDILELSYTSLEDDIKEIFLDVACTRLYYMLDELVIILESCGHFEARCGLDVLKEKSLITISYDGKKAVMHDQIIEMGRNIVRRPHRKEPHKHSHLWEISEIEHILSNDLGTEATEYIFYSTWELSSELFMKGLRKMKKLRYLSMHTESHDGYCFSGDWEFDEVTEYIPNSLQCLIWMYYPFSSLPKTFQANNLVMLAMPTSEIVQLWEGGDKKILKKLNYLDLRNSKLKILDLEMTPNLKDLKLSGCCDLVELLFPLQCLELTYIDLSHTKLRTLELWHTPVLSELRLEGCDNLVEIHIPFICPHLTNLYLGCCKLRALDLQATPNLKELILVKCFDLVELHISIECRLNLTFLSFHCPKLRSLDILGTLNLESLLIACDDLAELYIPAKWPKLRFLILFDSKLTTIDLQGAQNLETLDVRGCYNLKELRIHSNSLKLKSIDIMGAKLRTFKLGLTPNLKRLKLTKCFNLVELPAPEELGLLECLEALIISECTLLRDIPNSICKMKRLRYFHVEYCVAVEKLPEELGRLECLEELSIEGTNIRHLPQSIFEMKDTNIKRQHILLRRAVNNIHQETTTGVSKDEFGELRRPKEANSETTIVTTGLQNALNVAYIVAHCLLLTYYFFMENLPWRDGEYSMP
ncbi:hypothetical protein OSB04_016459 [Centaurea solstitialis]|uniref:TIR domain-containing protein n=1 Tax=Centaurea solstitialis TaxID=347529 RepID=A0AA38T2M1_9ASTR|nr:hypothetical protein OSB04_016459 [Centaurea solstitialis]